MSKVSPDIWSSLSYSGFRLLLEFGEINGGLEIFLCEFYGVECGVAFEADAAAAVDVGCSKAFCDLLTRLVFLPGADV
jgi:hypothetical protein